LYQTNDVSPEDKVAEVKSLFEQTQGDKAVQQAIETFTKRAFDQLDQTVIPQEAKTHLLAFGRELMSRKA
jgi:geranylgeranyl diphosphate synthase type II